MLNDSLSFLVKNWKRLLWLQVAACLLLSFILIAGKSVYDSGLKVRASDRHQYLLGLTEHNVHDFILRITQDVQQLAVLPGVKRFLDQQSTRSRKELEDALRKTSDIYGRYDQIRLLRPDGKELVRVNFHADGARIVPDTELQQKSDRYYVREGLSLRPGEVYLSPLDLNMEDGLIERPFKPVIRAVNLLRNDRGEPQALVVLNYNAGEFLNRFRALFSTGDRGMLVNAEGFWLSNHDRDNEWGWQLNRPEHNIAVWHKALWQQMQKAESGIYASDDEIISFRKIHPASFEDLSPGRFSTNSGLRSDVRIREWFAMVRSSRDEWLQPAFYHHGEVQIFIGLLYLLVICAVWLYVRNEDDKARHEDQKQRYTEELEDLYYNAPIGYLTVDGEARITNTNSRLQQSLGYSRLDLMGTPLTDLLSEDSVPLFQAALEQPHAGDIRLRVRCRDGSWLPVTSSVSSKFDGASLTMSRCSVQDISLQLQLEQRLRALANIDALTGAYNRRHIETLYQQTIKQARIDGLPVSVLALDIDHFKSINDKYGHGVGDEVLIAFTRSCLAVLKDRGYFARLGGEEFLALLPDTSEKDALLIAEELRQRTMGLTVVTNDEQVVTCTVSVGAAALAGDYTAALDQLIYKADVRLYEAKGRGRNCVV